ncbi:PTS system mannose/fructose/sorbose family transporter subunit IID [Lederbergia sp. NSJ-179]|uniref:PTS system mannose/fructose/sorbose family transporter subunit IID n=1 Tax=Lederbergia sp. NSJ-179 TaxID=2931402 RepID=UPI001FD3A6E5|nr:PTS system mannose/fructose/sorbose family transporter subunit IID [Lederbergia sp. NSJ-179]
MKTSDEKKEKNRLLNKIFLRSLTLEYSFNYERQQALGFAFTMIPALRKLYKRKEEMAKALQRHLEFFNVTPYVSTFIFGLTVAMEEENARSKDFDTSTINSVKASLMGSLSGIGDSLYWGTIRLIATGIGTSLALKGNFLGVILFFLFFNIPTLVLSYTYLQLGYRVGTNFLSKLSSSGLMEKLTYGASILGLLVIGGMSASMIKTYVPIDIGVEDSPTKVQDILDQIMPGLIPLGIFWILYWLLGKGVKTTTLLIGIFVVGILFTFLGVFGIQPTE